MTFEELFSSMKFTNDVEKDKFKSMFSFYVSELPENFYLNQFELASKYTGTDYEAWTRFLQHQAFDSWKTKTEELIEEDELL